MPKIKTNRAAAKRFKKTGTGKYRNIKKLAGISQTKRKSNSTDCRAKKWGSIF